MLSLSRPGNLFMALKYEPSKVVTVMCKKPFGAVFEEVEENEDRGVYVYECNEGNLAETNAVRAGMILLSVNGIDTRTMGFDGVMDMLRAADTDAPVELSLIDSDEVYRGKAVLDVALPGGGSATVQCLKGQLLRDVLLQADLELYNMKGKMTNCGGGGVCGTCVVGLDVAMNDWDPRPDMEAKRLKKYPDNTRLTQALTLNQSLTLTLTKP